MSDMSRLAGYLFKKLLVGLGREDRSVEKQGILDNEELSLLHQLQKGGSCIVCGSKGTHIIEKCIHKIVKVERTSIWPWRKKTTYFDKRVVTVPFCLKHFLRAMFQEIFCIVLAIGIAAGISYSMYSEIGKDDTMFDLMLAVFIFIVYCFIFRFILRCFFVGFRCVWKIGPLKRLLELKWIKGEFKV